MSNRSELAAEVATSLGVSAAEADRIVAAVSNSLTVQLAKNGETVLVGFGRFRVDQKAAREGRNPRDGSVIQIEAKSVVKFKTFPSFVLPDVPAENAPVVNADAVAVG